MNDVERIKKEKGGLEVWNDLQRIATEGYAGIDADDMFRLRWLGLYEQKPKDGYFMLRIKVPGGQLTYEQLIAVAEVTRDYARNIADITTRQNFQFHWMAPADFRAIFDIFSAVGISTLGACGDIPRNVTGCPVAGLDPNETFDAQPYAQAIHEYFLGNPEFADLPRKYKISITGCCEHCSQPEINDIAATAVIKNGEKGFHLRVGGGLSTRPFLAQKLNFFIPADKLVDAFRAVTEVYRDSGYRENRKKARIKFLVADWGAAKYEEEVLKRLSWVPEPALTETEWPEPTNNFRDHVGVHAQSQPGLFWVGANVLTGRMNSEQLFEVARLAKEFGTGDTRTTNQQNLLIPNIKEADVPEVVAALEAIGFPVAASPIRRAAVACTGSEFCNLALTETKNLMWQIVRHLDKTVLLDEPLRINLNGCPNGCGQHHIGDIGLQGCVVKLPGGDKVDGYDISLGGRLGRDAKFVRPIWRKVPATDIPLALENLLNGYLNERADDEDFPSFVDRASDEELGALMRTAFVEAA